jgi:hypothetical protein
MKLVAAAAVVAAAVVAVVVVAGITVEEEAFKVSIVWSVLAA